MVRRSSRNPIKTERFGHADEAPPGRKRKDSSRKRKDSSSESPSKKQRSSSLLGLKRVGLGENDSSSIVIPLRKGSLLGRNATDPQKMPANHVDLGITKSNGGEQISRKLLEVLGNSKGEILFRVSESTNANQILKYEQGGNKLNVIPGISLALKEDDILIIHKRHRFRVAPYVAVVSPNVVAKNNKENVVATSVRKEKQQASKKDYLENGRIILPSTMQLFRPTRTWGVETPTCQPSTTKKTKEESSKKKARPASKKTNDGDNSEDDDDDCEDGPREMHVSLANAYWKALNSSTPHMGANFLHTLLDTAQLPPLKLCDDLIKLLTFGPQTAGHAFYDGHRLALAHQFLQRLVQEFPGEMHQRLSQAAGNDHWKTILESLYTLPYDGNLEDSLNMFGFSLKLLEELLVLPLESSFIFQHIQDYGGEAACKVAANAMTHIWIQYGHYIWGGTNPALQAVTCQVTTSLARIVSCLLNKFVTKNNQAVDILWNAMDGKIRAKQEKTTKQWKQSLKLYWACSLEDYTKPLVKRVGVQKEYAQMMGQ